MTSGRERDMKKEKDTGHGVYGKKEMFTYKNIVTWQSVALYTAEEKAH